MVKIPMTELNRLIGFRRLHHQRISSQQFASPDAVVRWMGAMQAQDYAQVVWAVGARTQHPALSAVEQAVADGKIICTWAMRGTIHFVPPENARWMLKWLAARVVDASDRRLKQLELTQSDIHRCRDLCENALQGGKRLTRDQLLEVFDQGGIAMTGQRGYHILTQLAQRGVICMGAREGKQQTFVLLEEWIAPAPTISREEALATIARIYFTSHAPATEYDLAWWVGTTISDARLGIAGAGDALRRETIDGQTYFMGSENEPVATAESAYLLPGFDEFLLGYKDRGAVVTPDHMQRIVPGNNGVFRPMIVVDGQIIGTWTRAVKKGHTEVTCTPFTQLSDTHLALTNAAAQSYANFQRA